VFGNWIFFTLIRVCRFSYSCLGICYPGLGFLSLDVFGYGVKLILILV
jgi:hypothetical protein